MFSKQAIAALALSLSLTAAQVVQAKSPCGCQTANGCSPYSSVDNVFSSTPDLDLNSVVSDPGAPGPLMIGDRFGGTEITGFFSGLGGPAGGIGGSTAVTGRVKNAEFFSPLPRNRVFMNYSYFKNADIGNSQAGVGVHRYTPGLEVATPDGNMSVEFRLPFAQTIDNVRPNNSFHTNLLLGNLQIVPKVLLWEDDTNAFSAGLGIEAPTASDFHTGVGTPIAVNKAWHLMPFFSSIHSMDDFVVTSILQFDFFANENTIGGIGVDEEDWMYYSLAVNYYLSRSDDGFLRGVVPTCEVHVSQTISEFNGNGATGGAGLLTVQESNITDVNLVLGSHFLVGDGGVFTVGYTAPLTRNDGQFDGELRFVYNHFFDGGSLFNR